MVRGSTIRLLLVGSLLGAVSGCAHSPVQSDAASDAASQQTPAGTAAGPVLPAKPLVQVIEAKEMEVNGVRLKNTRFDIPVVVNRPVEKWVDYFTGRGRKHFERYLERAEFFVPFIQPILRQNGMPEDLVYLALIESGFANHARSHARAVGPWQFMTFTGKRYGLTVNWWVDERRDTEKSTLAAIRYLKDLYALFNSWEFASSAYNAGEAKIARAIKRARTTDFWQLIAKSRYLRSETRNYYAKMLAAAIVAKNRTQFGFPESYRKDIEPLLEEAETDVPPKAIDIEQEGEKPSGQSMANLIEEVDDEEETADATDEEVGEAAAVAMLVREAEGGGELDGKSGQVLARPVPVPTPHVSKRGEVGTERLVQFEVQSPADLLKVAQASGVSYLTVKALNPEVLRWCTPPYMKSYRIKLPESAKSKFLESYNQASFARSVRFRAYKVQRGDNLKKIARRFGIKEDPIIDLNTKQPLKGTGNIRQGTELYLPIPTDNSRSIASLDLYDPPDQRRRRRYRRVKRHYRVTYKDRRAAREEPRYPAKAKM